MRMIVLDYLYRRVLLIFISVLNVNYIMCVGIKIMFINIVLWVLDNVLGCIM